MFEPTWLGSNRYRKGLTYLKKQGNHKSKPNITFTKTEEKSTQAWNKWKPSNQKKIKKINTESTGKQGLKWQ